MLVTDIQHSSLELEGSWIWIHIWKFSSSFRFLIAAAIAFHWFIWPHSSLVKPTQRAAGKTTTQTTKKWCRKKEKKITLLSRVSIARIINMWLKKTFLGECASKKILTCTFLVDPVEWQKTNIFFKLVSTIFYFFS